MKLAHNDLNGLKEMFNGLVQILNEKLGKETLNTHQILYDVPE